MPPGDAYKGHSDRGSNADQVGLWDVCPVLNALIAPQWALVRGFQEQPFFHSFAAAKIQPMPLPSRIVTAAASLRPWKRKPKSIWDRIQEQQIRPAKPENALLGLLPDELIWHIIEFIGDTDLGSLRDLSLVCSYLFVRVSSVLLRNVSFNLLHLGAAKAQVDRLFKIGCISSIRTLRVTRGYGHDLGSTDIMSLIANNLPAMTGLHEIFWENSIIPKGVLGHMVERPHIRLHVKIDTQVTDKAQHHQPEPYPSHVLFNSLRNCLNLVSLTADIVYFDASYCIDTTAGLRHVLLSCPRLASLDLDIHGPGDVCTPVGPFKEYVGLGFHDGERFPALEVLKITRYPFGRHESIAFLEFDSKGYPGDGTEEDYWIDVFDWSRLRRLHYFPHVLAKKLAPNLISLTELDLTYFLYWNEIVLIEFLVSLPTRLEVVRLPSGLTAATTVALIQHHSTGLRSLSLTSIESWSGKFPNSVVSIADLQLMAEGLPHLEELVLDLRRDGDKWPLDVLEVVAAAFPRLRRLDLHFELGSVTDEPVRPYLTAKAAKDLAMYLQQRASTRLRHVRLLCGGPPYRQDRQCIPGPAVTHGWQNRCATSFSCEITPLHQLDESAPFSIRCERLNRELNEKLWQAVKGEKEIMLPVVDIWTRFFFKVALEGPLPMKEYYLWVEKSRSKPPHRFQFKPTAWLSRNK